MIRGACLGLSIEQIAAQQPDDITIIADEAFLDTLSDEPVGRSTLALNPQEHWHPAAV